MSKHHRGNPRIEAKGSAAHLRLFDRRRGAQGSSQDWADNAQCEAARRRTTQDRRHQELQDRTRRVRRARRRHHLQRPRGARGTRQEEVREPRAGMDALHPPGPKDRAHRTAHGAAVHWHASPNVSMRREQAEAVKVTHAYFLSRWAEDMHAVPRFLWNAKMRFGKTFTTYQLARKLGAKRVLVVTFKPAVEDAWQTDLENHVDFNGWQYLSKSPGETRRRIDRQEAGRLFRLLSGLAGPRRGRKHQAEERMAAHGELGPRSI